MKIIVFDWFKYYFEGTFYYFGSSSHSRLNLWKRLIKVHGDRAFKKLCQFYVAQSKRCPGFKRKS